MTTGAPLSSTNITLDRRLFTLALLLSTWVPMAFFITVGSLGTLGGRLDMAKATLLVVGGAHVAATLMLYVDKRFLSLRSSECSSRGTPARSRALVPEVPVTSPVG